jgi:hypothetical protein
MAQMSHARPSSSRSFSAQKGSSMRASMEKVLRVGKKYSALVPARTPTTWVMQWRMDCRAVVQVKSNLLPDVLRSPIHHRVGGVGGADMKIGKQIERRARRRFGLALTVQFRLARKGSTSHWGTGAIHNVSSSGISFQCRGPLPVGCHLEVAIEWPATRGPCPIRLLATGFVVRSSATRTAMQITWHRLRIAPPATEISLSAIA